MIKPESTFKDSDGEMEVAAKENQLSTMEIDEEEDKCNKKWNFGRPQSQPDPRHGADAT